MYKLNNNQLEWQVNERETCEMDKRERIGGDGGGV